MVLVLRLQHKAVGCCLTWLFWAATAATHISVFLFQTLAAFNSRESVSAEVRDEANRRFKDLPHVLGFKSDPVLLPGRSSLLNQGPLIIASDPLLPAISKPENGFKGLDRG